MSSEDLKAFQVKKNREQNKFFLVAAAAVSVLLSITARAAVITVAQDGSGDYLTIQEGIEASNAGDTVKVMPGYYNTAGEREINGEMRRANVFLKSGVEVHNYAHLCGADHRAVHVYVWRRLLYIVEEDIKRGLDTEVCNPNVCRDTYEFTFPRNDYVSVAKTARSLHCVQKIAVDVLDAGIS